MKVDFFFMHFDISTLNQGYMVVTFDNKPNFKFIYLKSGLNFNFKDSNLMFVKEVNIYDEDALLDGLTDKDKEEYGKKLIEFGFEAGYKILATFDQNSLGSINVSNKYEEHDNDDRYTLYIILRNDLDRSISQKMIDVSDITTTISEDLRTKAVESEYWKSIWCDFINLETNTVILQASGKDLFEDNYIPTKYDDPEIVFNYIWDNEERVAHGNFRLKEGTTVALGYFGKKGKMPKFIRKLALYKGE